MILGIVPNNPISSRRSLLDAYAHRPAPQSPAPEAVYLSFAPPSPRSCYGNIFWAFSHERFRHRSVFERRVTQPLDISDSPNRDLSAEALTSPHGDRGRELIDPYLYSGGRGRKPDLSTPALSRARGTPMLHLAAQHRFLLLIDRPRSSGWIERVAGCKPATLNRHRLQPFPASRIQD